jgi:hypothetical protein
MVMVEWTWALFILAETPNGPVTSVLRSHGEAMLHLNPSFNIRQNVPELPANMLASAMRAIRSRRFSGMYVSIGYEWYGLRCRKGRLAA